MATLSKQSPVTRQPSIRKRRPPKRHKGVLGSETYGDHSPDDPTKREATIALCKEIGAPTNQCPTSACILKYIVAKSKEHEAKSKVYEAKSKQTIHLAETAAASTFNMAKELVAAKIALITAQSKFTNLQSDYEALLDLSILK